MASQALLGSLLITADLTICEVLRMLRDVLDVSATAISRGSHGCAATPLTTRVCPPSGPCPGPCLLARTMASAFWRVPSGALRRGGPRGRSGRHAQDHAPSDRRSAHVLSRCGVLNPRSDLTVPIQRGQHHKPALPFFPSSKHHLIVTEAEPDEEMGDRG